MSQPQKGVGGKPNSASDDNGSHPHQCKVSGDVKVSGEIKANLPPDFVEEYKTSSKKSDRREEKRYFVELIALVSVLVVAVFSGIQTRQVIKNTEASIIAADAAKRASDTANETLHVSQRAYLVTGTPVLNAPKHILDIPIMNIGNIPTGVCIGTVHEATLAVDPMLPGVPVEEAHWSEQYFRDIAKGGTGIFVDVNLPAVSDERVQNGKQNIMVAGELLYNDGFEDTPQRKTTFCFITAFDMKTHILQLISCDPARGIPLIKHAEKYPAHREIRDYAN